MAMRVTGKKTRDKYGCMDCLDKCVRKSGIKCPHNACPYKAELDKYANYEEFIQKTENIVGILLKMHG